MAGLPKWIGRLDYRVYEYYGRLQIGSPMHGWVIKLMTIVNWLKPRSFWLGSLLGKYLCIANSAGWEDVHNLGVKYMMESMRHNLPFILPMVAP